MAGLYPKSPKLETQISILNRDIEVYLYTMEHHLFMKMNELQTEANLV